MCFVFEESNIDTISDLISQRNCNNIHGVNEELPKDSQQLQEHLNQQCMDSNRDIHIFIHEKMTTYVRTSRRSARTLHETVTVSFENVTLSYIHYVWLLLIVFGQVIWLLAFGFWLWLWLWLWRLGMGTSSIHPTSSTKRLIIKGYRYYYCTSAAC